MRGKIAQKNDVAVQECRGPGAPRKVVNKPSKHKKLLKSLKFKFHYFRDQHINMTLSPFVRSQQQIFQNGFHQQDIIIPSASQGLSGDAGNGGGRYPPPSIAARRRPSGATYPPPGPSSSNNFNNL